MLIHVKVVADSKTDSVTCKNPRSYTVHVRVPAERNQANRVMISLLAYFLKIEPRRLRIITGHHMPGKILEVVE
jgi:uncharacterized protein YggU (UPF0235/DUF167 family)